MIKSTSQSSAVTVFFSWLVVAVPLAWGIYNTLLNALKLLRNS